MLSEATAVRLYETPRMTSMPSNLVLAPELKQHPGYARVFQPGHLTFGFIAPLESYPNSPGPTLQDHAHMAQKVDEAGFSAIWLRDVPFYDPNFGDVGQILDPLVYAGFLAAVTQDIAIGTAGIVLPLRDPLIVAKQAASVDQLLGGRFIMGLATGDSRWNTPLSASTSTTAPNDFGMHWRSFAPPRKPTGPPTRRVSMGN